MSRNPILTDEAFDPSHYGGTATATRPSPAQEWEQAQAGGSAQNAGATQAAADAAMYSQAPPASVTTGRTMTMGGTAWATLLLLLLAGATGVYGWTTVTATQVGVDPQTGEPVVQATLNQPILLIVAMLVGLAFVILSRFKPNLSAIGGIGYALSMGYVLGAISHLYDAEWNGIVIQAILGTGSVFLVMLVLYGLRVLRATPKMVKMVTGAVFGILIMYLIAFVASLFGADMAFVYGPLGTGNSGGGLGILLSLFIVGVGAFMLILDFDFVEKGSKAGLPGYMDWYGAIGLMVTLVWIYLEMLRLLARLRS